MDKLGDQLKLKLQKHMSASVDFLNPQKNVFASEVKECELSTRASSAEIVAPFELDKSLRAAIETGMPASPFVGPSHACSEPFKATLLWEKIVIHLERTVKTGRHNLGLKTYENCFHGSKAVDSLVVYLNTILPRIVKRPQVLVLCEKLLETGVIQQVKEKQEFREKGLYRFTYNHFWETSITTEANAGSCDSDEMTTTFREKRLSKSRSMEIIQIENSIHKTAPEHHNFRFAIPEGYASDSTVTISTHHRRKRKTRKISFQETEHRPKLHELTQFTKTKVQSIAKHLNFVRTKPPIIPHSKKLSDPKPAKKEISIPSPVCSKVHEGNVSRLPKQEVKSKRRLSHGEYLKIMEKENNCQIKTVAGGIRKRHTKKIRPRRSSRLRERDSSLQNSREWQYLSELSVSHSPPIALNSTSMNRSHSFSSRGDLELAQVSDTSARLSGKWIVYGFI